MRLSQYLCISNRS
uniref:Uncharacterized protein n=1 Tax=Arundo donax TaxID=35708 RepID=A0A0A9AHR6_ARUDO